MKAKSVGRLLLLMVSGAMILASRVEGADEEGAATLGELVAQLELVRLEMQPYRLELSDEVNGMYLFSYEDRYTGKARRCRTPFLPVGAGKKSEFFQNPPKQGWFRLVGILKQPWTNPRTGITSIDTVAKIEVISGPKMGTQYQIRRQDKTFIIRDYKAVLVFPRSGQKNHQFEVMDGESFSLPYDVNAAKKPFTFQKVNEDGAVVIEWEGDGEVGHRALEP